MEENARRYGLDNIRFFLIFCVVFAHLLEIAAPFPGRIFLYKLIYSFHMPAFIFLFGYFTRFSPGGILRGWVVPYLLFQTLYCLFDRYILGNAAALQYHTPYWLMWYLLACIFYQLLIPLYDRPGRGNQLLALGCTVAIALCAGYICSIGYALSLSRFFVFQPWFLLGRYCRRHNGLTRLAQLPPGRKTGLAAAVVTGLVGFTALLFIWKVPHAFLSGCYCYCRLDCTVWMRLTAMAAAFFWICFLFAIAAPMAEKRLPILTTIGQNTWPVFLLHGFLVKAIGWFWPDLVQSPGRVLLLTGGILLLLGNRFAGQALRFQKAGSA